MMLSDVVTVARRFQRSVRVDTDLGTAGALNGFICHGSSKVALETMAKLMVETEQRAFTWTGPYGGGKSSLALALCGWVNADPQLRKRARSLLSSVTGLADAFPAGRDGWLVVPVVGRRADPVGDMREAIAIAVSAAAGGAKTRRRKVDPSGRDVIERLQSEAVARPKGGVLVVIDEMGKFLEGAAGERADVHFFQELAESAGRCGGRLVILGILHQAFEQYASRLGRQMQDEWAKVQGRYVDIPIVAAVDEVIDLTGRAIVSQLEHPTSFALAEKVAEGIRRRRPGSPEDLASRLDACWPLHPATAALLGPVSRRRFGQNERSTFGFLGSSEPEGFQEFLHSMPAAQGGTYDPARLWDYLRINLEPAILASPDGHRWAQGAEAVERCEGRGTPLHIQIAKTIALIDLFRNGSGLMPDRVILQSCFADVTVEQINKALSDLEGWSIIVFRKHLDAWAIYAGSDFDIGEAVEAAIANAVDLDLGRLARLAQLQPLLAKEHYHRTGTLRWFETELGELSNAKESVGSFDPRDGASGKFLLAIPSGEESDRTARDMCRHASELAGQFPVAVGMPRNAWLVRQLGKELLALETVRATRPELEGDQVARREVAARIAAVSAQLEEELRASFNEATWYVRGTAYDERDARALAQLASRVADDTFPEAPFVHSELVNREKPSSNSQAAVRLLLHAMVSHADQEFLGIEGYPAERGLYSTVLAVTGLHGKSGEQFGFKAPTRRSTVGSTLVPMWRKAEELIKSTDGPVTLDSLYELWTAPPFGIRRGLLPIFALAFVLQHESTVAVYADETFQPELNDFVADRLLQDERLISLRSVDRRAEDEQLMKELASAVSNIVGRAPASEPLGVARALVEFIFRLPNWTRRTSSLSKAAQGVRRILLNASDPHRTLFVDLPRIIETRADESPGTVVAAALHELTDAYPAMLNELQVRMLDALGHKGRDFQQLRKRASAILGLTGDLRLEAFVTRIAEFNGDQEDIEAIAGLVIHKPARDWSDLDPNKAALEVTDLSLRFRHTEVLAGVQAREPTQHAVAVVFGTGEAGRTVMKSFDIPPKYRIEVDELAEQIVGTLRSSGLSTELLVAALAEAGVRTVDDDQANALKVAAS